MAKKVIKYEAKDGTLFDKWDDALAHDRDAGVRRWFRYAFTTSLAMSGNNIYDEVTEHFDLRPKPAFYHVLKHLDLLEREERERLIDQARSDEADSDGIAPR